MFKNFFKGGNNDFYLELEEESKDTPSKPAQPPTASNGAKSATAVAPTPESKPVEKEKPKAAEVAKT
ncbi:hypothetical protein, partial [Calothrix rhizosoleniae]|uniref:hypothetical protein n=1 Tax=Calothrix rhizosoleniae TaxID=888997 RepID=UPI00389925C7